MIKLNANVNVSKDLELGYLGTQYIDYDSEGTVVGIYEDEIYKYKVEFNIEGFRRVIDFKEGELITIGETEENIELVKDINKYQNLSKRTLNKTLNKEQTLNNMVYGLVGESGEVVDALKKHLYQGHELNKENMKEELGDLMFYVVNLCSEMNLRMDDVLQYNLDKLNKRYPKGFDIKRSVHRDA